MTALYTFLLAVLLSVAGIWLSNRPDVISVQASIPDKFPDAGFSHDDFEVLLTAYVDDEGDVNYSEWYRSPDALEKLHSYLAAVASYSPENAAERFPHSSDALAYWLYAYNAYVIHSILLRWPIDSVTDVKAPFEIVKGFGFFYRQRFVFGGQQYSLYDVENKKIRSNYKDPRIHFVLNCGSGSCPPMRPDLPTGEQLEEFLQQATVDFVCDRDNVRIDHDRQRIIVSAIFKWFRKDFENHVVSRGLSGESAILSYISGVAPQPLKSELDKARAYDLAFNDYDWSVNRAD